MNVAQQIAEQFVHARLAARALSAYPGTVPDDLPSAYAVQEAAIEMWPDTIVGWKVARISPNWPPEWGDRCPEPRLNGPVFARNLHVVSGDQLPMCPVFENGFAAVETEIVIRVGQDAPKDKTQWTLTEAKEYVGDVHLGIEVASSPLSTLNEFGAASVVSDFGNNWGVVVGPKVVDWQSITHIDCAAYIDGVEVGARPVDMIQGPLDAFVFTLGKCAARKRPLRAGMWITTGMITGVHDIRIGQSSRHTFELNTPSGKRSLGEVGCRIVRAQPFE